MRWAGVALFTMGVVMGLWAPASGGEITPAMEAELGKQMVAIAAWAADPVIVSAVKEQNGKGPIVGMDNTKWKSMRRSDPMVQAMVNSPAGQLLKKKIETSHGALDKAFLSAAQGEKVAFAEKTISYIHKGQEKFDAPMSTAKPWRMQKIWYDESLQAYAVQVAAPILDGGKPIGVLVASVPVAYLEKAAK